MSTKRHQRGHCGEILDSPYSCMVHRVARFSYELQGIDLVAIKNLVRGVAGGLVGAAILMGVAAPANAETQSHSDAQVPVNTQTTPNKIEAAAKALEPYVVRAADGTFSINASSQARASIDDQTYNTLVSSTVVVNKLITSGELRSTPDLRVFPSGAPVYAVQGGETKVDFYWWGINLYLSTQDANLVEGGGGAAAALVSRLGVPGGIASVILGATSGILWACTGDNGLVWHITYAVANWCWRQ